MENQQSVPNKRKRNLILATLVIAVVAAGYGIYWKAVLSHEESTDDAYVNGHLVQITPEIGGTVQSVAVDDTQSVKAGQLLVKLDQNDAKLAFERARNEFLLAIRQTNQQISSTQQYAAQVALRKTELAKAQDDFKRRQSLAGTESMSAEELSHAKDAVASAQAALDVAVEQEKVSHTLVGKDALMDQPAVKRAASQLKDAWLNLQRTEVKAPAAGVVARRSVQVGQRIAAGTPLMAVVPLDHLWVDANFKEGQLANVRIGQPVVMKSDLYGSKVEYHGKVIGLAAGTGSVFSLLPAQNATGNWIKVVQRVPVRIELDPQDLKAHPLRVGLSMDVDVDTSKQDGPVLAAAPDAAALVQANQIDLKGADEMVAQLLKSHASAAE